MAWVGSKRDEQEPFYLSSGNRKQTSAEIVAEARRSLRTLGTQRPYTPRDEHRHLFGDASAHARDGRPLSSFSLHAKSFEAPDSRPNSGTHLSPLEHKPKLPPALNEDCRGTGVPKPPAERMDRTTARARHHRVRSLTRLHTMTEESKVAQADGLDELDKLNMEPCQQDNKEKPQPSDDRDISRCRTETPPEPLIHTPTRHSGIQRPKRVQLYHAKGSTKEAAFVQADATKSDATYESVFWSTEVLPALQKFEAVVPGGSVTEETVEHLCSTCIHLYDVLSKKGLLGGQFKNRSSILRALFRLIDLGSDQLNLTLANLILALNVSGNNLLNICKLIFKISRNSSNDKLFQNSSILDSLLHLLQCEDVYSNGEAVLYSVGSLKLLSGNSTISRLLLAKGYIPVLLQLAQRLIPLNDPNASPGPNHTQTSGHILVQLTAALRNMADISESRSTFLTNDVFSTLCTVMDHYQNDQDICLNVARIFSKLSSYAECCYALAETPRCYGLFLDLLSKQDRKQDLVLRLLFTLGNLAARSDEARKRLYEVEGSIEILLGLFQTYQAALTPRTPQDPHSSLHKEEDVLIKLIRTLANLSIHPDAGTTLAANMLCVKLLLEVMEVISVEKSPELVVNATATINNLSYYQAESSVVRVQHERISKLLLRLLLSSNMDAVLEATRVFGNLSQIRGVRQFVFENKVHQFMVTLLDSKDPDVCFSACGVLVNLSVDKENRIVLREEGTVHKLIECLRDFGPLDWQLAGVTCQTLWNCAEGGEQQYTQELLEILSLYSDKEALQWPSSDDIKEYQEACWELEFLPVAQRLKKRILSHLTLLEPISKPS